MTLNTFHFAGHGAANVTLGIPRLREIVMTASQDIKTPTMQLPILKTVSDDRLKTFCQSSTRLTLSQVLVTVQERLSPKSQATNFQRQKVYTVKLNLFPRADYEAEYSISSEQILAGIARQFIPLLDKAITKEIKQNDRELKAQSGEIGRAAKVSDRSSKKKSTGADEDGAGEEDAGVVGRGADEEIDGDADDERRGRQAQDEQTYDSDEDEDKEDNDEAALEAKFKDASDAESDDEDDEDDEAEVDPEVLARKSKAESLERMKNFERKVPDTSRYVNKLTFDKEAGEWRCVLLFFPFFLLSVLTLSFSDSSRRKPTSSSSSVSSRKSAASPSSRRSPASPAASLQRPLTPTTPPTVPPSPRVSTFALSGRSERVSSTSTGSRRTTLERFFTLTVSRRRGRVSSMRCRPSSPFTVSVSTTVT
jgi:hypothetical protein